MTGTFAVDEVKVKGKKQGSDHQLSMNKARVRVTGTRADVGLPDPDEIVQFECKSTPEICNFN